MGRKILHSHPWDNYFMTMAYLVSMKSKDTGTRVGAVIVGPDKEIRSTGYNGLPRGIEDTEERYTNKEFKYLAGNHAEENAILNCVLIGVSARSCSIYTPWIPCARCAKAIIQSGISEVVYDVNFPGNDPEFQVPWKLEMEISREILQEANVRIKEFDGPLVKIEVLCKETKFDPKYE